MYNYKVGFIGAGNIATAIFNGISASGYIKPENVYVFDVDSAKSAVFAEKGALVAESEASLTVSCDFVFLTVKPQIYPIVLDSIKNGAQNTCFIDVAAGVSIAAVKEGLGFDAPVIRVMPNTPLMFGLGSTALVQSSPVTDEQFSFIRGCFDSCGVTAVVDEKFINTVIAISGSSPAYIMRFAKLLIDYGISNGLDADASQALVLQTLSGCAKMIEESECAISQLIANVTSPNGTTASGLASLDSNEFDSVVKDCLDATVKRAEELSK